MSRTQDGRRKDLFVSASFAGRHKRNASLVDPASSLAHSLREQPILAASKAKALNFTKIFALFKPHNNFQSWPPQPPNPPYPSPEKPLPSSLHIPTSSRICNPLPRPHLPHAQTVEHQPNSAHHISTMGPSHMLKVVPWYG